MTLHPVAQALLETWFGTDDASLRAMAPRWWIKDPRFDERLREQFGEYVMPAAAGRYSAWEADPEPALALVLLLDQVPRNIFRGSPESFAYDAAAREVAARMRASGADRMLMPPTRAFAYMPLMHSEALADHAEGLARFEQLSTASRGGPWHELVHGNLDYCRQHAAILYRFGRYPHRNEVLGRDSTAEELAFLEEPGSSF